MKKFFSVCCWVLAVLFLICGIWPLFFGIFHIGNGVLLFLSFASLVFPFLVKTRKKRRWIKPVSVIMYSLGVIVICGISFSMLKQGFFKKPPASGKITIITLGCHIVEDQPSVMLRNRLIATKGYLDQNPSSVSIMTGGQGADEMYPEALIMARYLEGKGIDSERIFIEDRSTNTEENLRNALEFIPADSEGIVIVTDSFHQKRAAMLAESLGMSPVYSISSVTPYGLFPSYWMRDLGGVGLVWLKEVFS